MRITRQGQARGIATAAWALVFAVTFGTGAARAMGNGADAEPHVAGTPLDASAGLTASERRVVSWSVERILALAGSDASVIDITPEDITAGTGVDVATLDTDRVRDAVARRLLEIASDGASMWTPAAPVRPGAAAETSSSGVGEAPVGSGGGPTAPRGTCSATSPCSGAGHFSARRSSDN